MSLLGKAIAIGVESHVANSMPEIDENDRKRLNSFLTACRRLLGWDTKGEVKGLAHAMPAVRHIGF